MAPSMDLMMQTTLQRSTKTAMGRLLAIVFCVLWVMGMGVRGAEARGDAGKLNGAARSAPHAHANIALGAAHQTCTCTHDHVHVCVWCAPRE